MNALIVVASFLLVLGVIIFVHEAGHFLAAKLFNIRVLTFSLGFGQRLIGFTRGETEYRIAWIPLGGYVRLGGENPEEATGDPRDFQSHPRWQRIVVYLAGPAMNVILSVLLIAIVLMVGFGVPFLHESPPVVGTVEPDGAAAAAGLQPGDEVVAVRGKAVDDWEAVAMPILESPGKPVVLSVKRDGKVRQVTVVPTIVPKYEVGDAGMYPKVLPTVAAVNRKSPAEEGGLKVGDEVRGVDGRGLASDLEFVRYIESHAGQPMTVTVLRQEKLVDLVVTPKADGSGKGKIGVSLTLAARLAPWPALKASVRYNWNVAAQTLGLVGKLVRREMKPQSALHGPIEIAALSGEAAKQGLPSLMHLMALVSISIAILNLLPIPVLDGGQITVLLVESTIRRDLSIRLKEAINMVGLAFILLLMGSVLYFDARRNFGSGAQEPAKPKAAAPAASPAASPPPAVAVPGVPVP